MDSGNNNVAMLFATCDNYCDAWHPFFDCLHNNWPKFCMPIYLCSESKDFSKDGFNIKCPLAGTTNNNSWSSRILRTLKAIKEEYILFALEDFWLTSIVDDAKVNEIIRIMKDDSSIGYICMVNEKKPLSEKWGYGDVWCKECEYPLLWECTKDCKWRLTTQIGLWRKDYLIKMLRSHESAWSFEPLASWRSVRFSKKRVFDTKETIFSYPYGGVLWRGKVHESYIPLYDEDIIKPCIEKRGILKDSDTIPNPENKANKNIRYYINFIKSYSPKL